MRKLVDRFVRKDQHTIDDLLLQFKEKTLRESSGCFYISLLTCWEQLNPGKQFPRKALEYIIAQKTLRVSNIDFLRIIKDLESILKLCVVRVDIPIYLAQDEETTRKELGLNNFIGVVTYPNDGYVRTIDGDTTAIIDWTNQKERLFHYSSIHLSEVFKNEHLLNRGGNTSYMYLRASGFIPLLVFQIRKK